VDEHGDFKFDVQVDHSKSQYMDDKLFLKWALLTYWVDMPFYFKTSIPQKQMFTFFISALWDAAVLWHDKQ